MRQLQSGIGVLVQLFQPPVIKIFIITIIVFYLPPFFQTHDFPTPLYAIKQLRNSCATRLPISASGFSGREQEQSMVHLNQ
jgi:hypothetical protein